MWRCREASSCGTCGTSPSPANNLIDQDIGALRRKVDRHFGRTDVETVRGDGYRRRAETVPMPNLAAEGN
jgi:DNA-binding response OmpR family regulator